MNKDTIRLAVLGILFLSLLFLSACVVTPVYRQPYVGYTYDRPYYGYHHYQYYQ